MYIPQEFQTPFYCSCQAFCWRWWCRQWSTCGARTATHCLPAGLELPPLPHRWRWLESWSKHTRWAGSGSAGSWEERPIPSVCWHFLSRYLQGLMSSGYSLENNLITLQVDVTLPWATPGLVPPPDAYCRQRKKPEWKLLRRKVLVTEQLWHNCE